MFATKAVDESKNWRKEVTCKRVSKQRARQRIKNRRKNDLIKRRRRIPDCIFGKKGRTSGHARLAIRSEDKMTGWALCVCVSVLVWLMDQRKKKKTRTEVRQRNLFLMNWMEKKILLKNWIICSLTDEIWLFFVAVQNNAKWNRD